MSTGSRELPQYWTDAPPPALAWQSWPLREHPVGALLVLVLLAAVGVGVEFVTSALHLAALAVAAASLAMWRFFLPVAFELNPDGVDQWLFGRHRRIPWVAIRRHEVCPAGVLLLPFSDRSPLDALRGMYVPWGDHREEVLFQVRYYLNRPH